MRSRIGFVAVALVAAVLVRRALGVGVALPPRGIFDDAQIHYGDPDKVFPVLQQLHTQLIRVNLVWGGAGGVAKRRPANPANPADPAYDWSSYDRTVNYATQYGIKVVFSIIGTPPWANGAAGVNVAPEERARPAAVRRCRRHALQRPVQGSRRPPAAACAPLAGVERAEQPGVPAAAVPQGRAGACIVQSAIDYAKICNAIYKGVLRDDGRRVEGRVRRHRAAREQRADVRSPLGLAARVPARR